MSKCLALPTNDDFLTSVDFLLMLTFSDRVDFLSFVDFELTSKLKLTFC